jgi:carbonic anhydrase
LVVANPDFTPNVAHVVASNADYAQHFAGQDLALRPRRQLAVVACMDSRMDIFAMLGLAHGDAHVIRTGGGVVTDDVIRSLVISQRYLDTREIVLVHHTDCGMQKIEEGEMKDALEAETGVRPHWAVESFSDPFADVRQSVKRLQLSPFVPHRDHITGFVYDVLTGRLVPVDPD